MYGIGVYSSKLARATSEDSSESAASRGGACNSSFTNLKRRVRIQGSWIGASLNSRLESNKEEEEEEASGLGCEVSGVGLKPARLFPRSQTYTGCEEGSAGYRDTSLIRNSSTP